MRDELCVRRYPRFRFDIGDLGGPRRGGRHRQCPNEFAFKLSYSQSALLLGRVYCCQFFALSIVRPLVRLLIKFASDI